jgi:hypothetical protein
MIANDEGCALEIKSRIAMVKAALKKGSFYKQIGLKFKEQTSEVIRLKHRFDETWTLGK